MSVAKEDEAKLASKATGAKLSIFVYLGESPGSAFLQIEDNFPVTELKNRIKAVLAPALDKCVAKDLVVHTKDAHNKLHLLDNAELELADALKCDAGGKYRVYVEMPKVEAATDQIDLKSTVVQAVTEAIAPLTQQLTKAAKLSGITDTIWATMSRAVKYEAIATPEAKEPDTIQAFKWDGRHEEEQEKEYTAYMTKHFEIPEDIMMLANARSNQFLSCQPEFLPFKISGGIDVPFVLRRFEENGQPKQGIVLMVELKKPKALQESRESCFRQAFAEQIAGDYLSQKVVTTVLTDLIDYWQFFFSGDDAIYTGMLSRTQAITNIRRLLALGIEDKKPLVDALENDPFPGIKRQKITLGRIAEVRGGVEEQDLEGFMPLHELKSWRIGQALPYLLPHSLREFHSSGLTAEALSMFI